MKFFSGNHAKYRILVRNLKAVRLFLLEIQFSGSSRPAHIQYREDQSQVLGALLELALPTRTVTMVSRQLAEGREDIAIDVSIAQDKMTDFLYRSIDAMIYPLRQSA